MPPRSVQYTLVGFSAALDWRPLKFVKPIPQHRVCGACGLVRKMTALLPCSHTLCESCYDLSAQDGIHVCPLDSRQCENDDVELRVCDDDELLKREVKCWNEGADCTAVLPASKIAQHFQRDCRSHSISCPKCSLLIFCRDVCAHLSSECSSTTAAPAGWEYEGDSCRKDELTSFREILEEQAGEIKTLLQRLLTGSGTNSDRLDEVFHGVNNCQEALKGLGQGISSVKDTVKQEVAEGTREQHDCIKKLSDEISKFDEETKRRFNASNDTIQVIHGNVETIKIISNRLDTVEKVLQGELAKSARENRDKGCQPAGVSEEATEETQERKTATSHEYKAVPKPPYQLSSVHEFFVKGVKSLEEKARKDGSSIYESEEMHLRGYCVSPGVWLYSYCGIIELCACFVLEGSDINDAAEWPLKETIILRVKHPGGGAARELVVCPSDFFVCCQRPRDRRVQYIFHSYCYLLLEDLIRSGYVEEDQLRVEFGLQL